MSSRRSSRRATGELPPAAPSVFPPAPRVQAQLAALYRCFGGSTTPYLPFDCDCELRQYYYLSKEPTSTVASLSSASPASQPFQHRSSSVTALESSCSSKHGGPLVAGGSSWWITAGSSSAGGSPLAAAHNPTRESLCVPLKTFGAQFSSGLRFPVASTTTCRTSGATNTYRSAQGELHAAFDHVGLDGGKATTKTTVVLEGGRGAGKTTMLLDICRLWAWQQPACLPTAYQQGTVAVQFSSSGASTESLISPKIVGASAPTLLHSLWDSVVFVSAASIRGCLVRMLHSDNCMMKLSGGGGALPQHDSGCCQCVTSARFLSTVINESLESLLPGCARSSGELPPFCREAHNNNTTVVSNLFSLQEIEEEFLRNPSETMLHNNNSTVSSPALSNAKALLLVDLEEQDSSCCQQAAPHNDITLIVEALFRLFPNRVLAMNSNVAVGSFIKERSSILDSSNSHVHRIVLNGFALSPLADLFPLVARNAQGRGQHHSPLPTALMPPPIHLSCDRDRNVFEWLGSFPRLFSFIAELCSSGTRHSTQQRSLLMFYVIGVMVDEQQKKQIFDGGVDDSGLTLLWCRSCAESVLLHATERTFDSNTARQFDSEVDPPPNGTEMLKKVISVACAGTAVPVVSRMVECGIASCALSPPTTPATEGTRAGLSTCVVKLPRLFVLGFAALFYLRQILKCAEAAASSVRLEDGQKQPMPVLLQGLLRICCDPQWGASFYCCLWEVVLLELAQQSGSIVEDVITSLVTLFAPHISTPTPPSSTLRQLCLAEGRSYWDGAVAWEGGCETRVLRLAHAEYALSGVINSLACSPSWCVQLIHSVRAASVHDARKYYATLFRMPWGVETIAPPQFVHTLCKSANGETAAEWLCALAHRDVITSLMMDDAPSAYGVLTASLQFLQEQFFGEIFFLGDASPRDVRRNPSVTDILLALLGKLLLAKTEGGMPCTTDSDASDAAQPNRSANEARHETTLCAFDVCYQDSTLRTRVEASLLRCIERILAQLALHMQTYPYRFLATTPDVSLRQSCWAERIFPEFLVPLAVLAVQGEHRQSLHGSMVVHSAMSLTAVVINGMAAVLKSTIASLKRVMLQEDFLLLPTSGCGSACANVMKHVLVLSDTFRLAPCEGVVGNCLRGGREHIWNALWAITITHGQTRQVGWLEASRIVAPAGTKDKDDVRAAATPSTSPPQQQQEDANVTCDDSFRETKSFLKQDELFQRPSLLDVDLLGAVLEEMANLPNAADDDMAGQLFDLNESSVTSGLSHGSCNGQSTAASSPCCSKTPASIIDEDDLAMLLQRLDSLSSSDVFADLILCFALSANAVPPMKNPSPATPPCEPGKMQNKIFALMSIEEFACNIAASIGMFSDRLLGHDHLVNNNTAAPKQKKKNIQLHSKIESRGEHGGIMLLWNIVLALVKLDTRVRGVVEELHARKQQSVSHLPPRVSNHRRRRTQKTHRGVFMCWEHLTCSSLVSAGKPQSDRQWVLYSWDAWEHDAVALGLWSWSYTVMTQSKKATPLVAFVRSMCAPLRSGRSGREGSVWPSQHDLYKDDDASVREGYYASRLAAFWHQRAIKGTRDERYVDGGRNGCHVFAHRIRPAFLLELRAIQQLRQDEQQTVGVDHRGPVLPPARFDRLIRILQSSAPSSSTVVQGKVPRSCEMRIIPSYKHKRNVTLGDDASLEGVGVHCTHGNMLVHVSPRAEHCSSTLLLRCHYALREVAVEQWARQLVNSLERPTVESEVLNGEKNGSSRSSCSSCSCQWSTLKNNIVRDVLWKTTGVSPKTLSTRHSSQFQRPTMLVDLLFDPAHSIAATSRAIRHCFSVAPAAVQRRRSIAAMTSCWCCDQEDHRGLGEFAMWSQGELFPCVDGGSVVGILWHTLTRCCENQSAAIHFVGSLDCHSSQGVRIAPHRPTTPPPGTDAIDGGTTQQQQQQQAPGEQPLSWMQLLVSTHCFDSTNGGTRPQPRSVLIQFGALCLLSLQLQRGGEVEASLHSCEGVPEGRRPVVLPLLQQTATSVLKRLVVVLADALRTDGTHVGQSQPCGHHLQEAATSIAYPLIVRIHAEQQQQRRVAGVAPSPGAMLQWCSEIQSLLGSVISSLEAIICCAPQLPRAEDRQKKLPWLHLLAAARVAFQPAWQHIAGRSMATHKYSCTTADHWSRSDPLLSAALHLAASVESPQRADGCRLSDLVHWEVGVCIDAVAQTAPSLSLGGTGASHEPFTHNNSDDAAGPDIVLTLTSSSRRRRKSVVKVLGHHWARQPPKDVGDVTRIVAPFLRDTSARVRVEACRLIISALRSKMMTRASTTTTKECADWCDSAQALHNVIAATALQDSDVAVKLQGRCAVASLAVFCAGQAFQEFLVIGHSCHDNPATAVAQLAQVVEQVLGQLSSQVPLLVSQGKWDSLSRVLDVHSHLLHELGSLLSLIVWEPTAGCDAPPPPPRL